LVTLVIFWILTMIVTAIGDFIGRISNSIGNFFNGLL